MVSTIHVGDFELNYQHQRCSPTLVPQPGLEKRLNIKLLDARVINNTEDIQTRRLDSDIFAIHIHAFHLEELKELLEDIRLRSIKADLWISTDTSEKRDFILNLYNQVGSDATHSKPEVCITPNRGRNVGPLLSNMLKNFHNYTAVLHLHTKRHSHNPIAGKAWFEDLKDCLIGHHGESETIINQFSMDPRLGLVMPRPARVIRPHCNWGDNLATAELLCKTIYSDRKLELNAPLIFPAGMMFWFRPIALQNLKEMLDQLNYWPSEPIQLDGTPFHALERLVAHSCEAAGLNWALCSPRHEWSELEGLHPTQISVWEARPVEYQQATALLANRLWSCEDECESLRNRISDLHHSRSWRLTSLFRYLSQRLRKN